MKHFDTITLCPLESQSLSHLLLCFSLGWFDANEFTPSRSMHARWKREYWNRNSPFVQRRWNHRSNSGRRVKVMKDGGLIYCWQTNFHPNRFPSQQISGSCTVASFAAWERWSPLSTDTGAGPSVAATRLPCCWWIRWGVGWPHHHHPPPPVGDCDSVALLRAGGQQPDVFFKFPSCAAWGKDSDCESKGQLLQKLVQPNNIQSMLPHMSSIYGKYKSHCAPFSSLTLGQKNQALGHI